MNPVADHQTCAVDFLILQRAIKFKKRQGICWPEGRNWLEMEVKPRKIQARVTEFSTVSQRSGLKSQG
jgi:hypothetical protein